MESQFPGSDVAIGVLPNRRHGLRVDELYEICTDHLVDVETILNALVKWIQEHPDRIDHAL